MGTKAERIVDRTELGKFLNVDADYVSMLVREGMPKVHHGRYELVRCLSWYVEHLQESLKKRAARVTGNLVGEVDRTKIQTKIDREIRDALFALARSKTGLRQHEQPLPPFSFPVVIPLSFPDRVVLL